MRSTARRGEDLAVAVATSQGYQVLARNYRCRLGEIDLVLAREGQLVFVEVKTRTGASHGQPWEAVTYGKQQRLKQLAHMYISQTGRGDCQVRFDVFAVMLIGGRWQYRWFKNAYC